MPFRRFQGLAGAAALMLAAAPGAGAVETGAVTVYRGAETSSVSFPAAGTGPVLVQRGPAVKTPAYVPPGATALQILAGRRLWIVDSRTGRVTACSPRRSIQVGRRKIRCTTRVLPDMFLPTAD